MKQEQTDGVAGAGANGPRGQRVGGPRGVGHRDDRGARPQGGIQGHATIADLKNKIAGKERPGFAPKKANAAQPQKLNSLLKQMKKGF
jgi:uncharacterized protein